MRRRGWFDKAFADAARQAERDIRAKVRRMVNRQRYRAHIRREQEEFLQQHPELRLPDPKEKP